MFTSNNEKTENSMLKNAFGNLLFASFCALFGAIYESFSFGVFSFFMIYSFAFPFAAGLFLLIAYMRGKEYGQLFTLLFNAATVTAATGCLAAGVVEIYGSENRLLIIYPIAAGALFIGSVSVFAVNRFIKRQ